MLVCASVMAIKRVMPRSNTLDQKINKLEATHGDTFHPK